MLITGEGGGQESGRSLMDQESSGSKFGMRSRGGQPHLNSLQRHPQHNPSNSFCRPHDIRHSL